MFLVEILSAKKIDGRQFINRSMDSVSPAVSSLSLSLSLTVLFPSLFSFCPSPLWLSIYRIAECVKNEDAICLTSGVLWQSWDSIRRHSVLPDWKQLPFSVQHHLQPGLQTHRFSVHFLQCRRHMVTCSGMCW